MHERGLPVRDRRPRQPVVSGAACQRRVRDGLELDEPTVSLTVVTGLWCRVGNPASAHQLWMAAT